MDDADRMDNHNLHAVARRPMPMSAPGPLIPEHGGEWQLGSFQISRLCSDVTVRFCDRSIENRSRYPYHLGYEAGEKPQEVGNHRNGYGKKTIIGEDGAIKIAVPRDRDGSFDPLLIGRYQKRFEGFDEKIIAMDARGTTVREIQGFLLDQYKVEIGADFISTVTDSVLETVVEWQNQPLERCIRWCFSMPYG